VEAQPPRCFQLFPQLIDVYNLAQPHRGRTVEQRERHVGLWKLLPDELKHQQLVEIRVQQGAGYRVQFPVVIVRASGKVDNHNVSTLLGLPPVCCFSACSLKAQSRGFLPFQANFLQSAADVRSKSEVRLYENGIPAHCRDAAMK
jgi:hypothetical protein